MLKNFWRKLRANNPFRILTPRDLGMQEKTVEEIAEGMKPKANEEGLTPLHKDFGRLMGRIFARPGDRNNH